MEMRENSVPKHKNEHLLFSYREIRHEKFIPNKFNMQTKRVLNSIKSENQNALTSKREWVNRLEIQ